MSKFLDVAFEALRAAEKVTLRYYRLPSRSRNKADGSPVTAADTGAERAIRATIRKHFPNHGFFGEEYGHTNARSDFLWLIDPIDGTKNYINRIPLWGTLIALMHEGEFVLGVSHVPLMDELLWAERGKGAFLNKRRVHVSGVSRLHESMISYGSLASFKEKRAQRRIIRLADACLRQRSFGDLWPYHLLASGRLEIVVEAWIKAVDVAPFAIIIEEAGGMTSDMNGKPFSLDIGSFMATNGRLHELALAYLKK